jgi:hypothetical protein
MACNSDPGTDGLQNPADVDRPWEGARKDAEGGATALRLNPDEANSYLSNGDAEIPSSAGSGESKLAELVGQSRTGFESWASVQSRSSTPLSSQYDWKDAPERAGAAQPPVPTSVFALMQSPWGTFGEAVDSDIPKPSARRVRISDIVTSSTDASWPPQPHEVPSRNSLHPKPSSQARPKSAAQDPPIGHIPHVNGVLDANTHPSANTQSSSSGDTEMPQSSSSPQVTSEDSQSPEHASTDVRSAVADMAVRSTPPGSLPGSPPGNRQAPPAVQRGVSMRRVPGWGDPFVAPPIAWPPAKKGTPDRSPSDLSQAPLPSRAEGEGPAEPSGDAPGGTRQPTDNEEFFDPPEEPAKEEEEQGSKEQRLKSNALFRFLAAVRAKGYDAREDWILVCPRCLSKARWTAGG